MRNSILIAVLLILTAVSGFFFLSNLTGRAVTIVGSGASNVDGQVVHLTLDNGQQLQTNDIIFVALHNDTSVIASRSVYASDLLGVSANGVYSGPAVYTFNAFTLLNSTSVAGRTYTLTVQVPALDILDKHTITF